MKAVLRVVRDQPMLKAHLVVWRTMTKTAHAGTKKVRQPPTSGSQDVEETFKKCPPMTSRLSSDCLSTLATARIDLKWR